MTGRRIAARLFVTVWLVYALHLTSNVVRETYLAVALGDSLSVRVDPFLGLHPDIFAIEGRGAYINSNPGASILAAIPYALSRPATGLLFTLKPGLIQPKPPATYNDPRPNRARLMNAMRARGLDVKLALAAFAVQLGLMAPLGALAAVVLYRALTTRLGDERRARWLALLYAFGTPLLFRSAFLNQNALIAHLVLFAYLLLSRPGAVDDDAGARRRWLSAGALLGLGVLCDYSGAAIAVAFGWWALAEGFARARAGGAVRRAAWLALGAVGPVLLLLAYQWAAFGSPWLPAQAYMPATPYSGLGWHGVALPAPALLLGNLFDPRYGLFVFCPMLIAGLASPLISGGPGALPRRELILIYMACAALWLFSSANQYAFLQWNTGVRYMVPAVPLLFIALVPVLLKVPAWLRWLLIVPTLLISLAVTMTREDVPTALQRIALNGPELPMTTVLLRTAEAYAPWLSGGAALAIAVGAYGVLALLLWLVWRGAYRPAVAAERTA